MEPLLFITTPLKIVKALQSLIATIEQFITLDYCLDLLSLTNRCSEIYKNIQKCTIKGGNLRVLRICPLSGCEVLLDNITIEEAMGSSCLTFFYFILK